MSNENRTGAGRRHDLDALRAFAMLVGIVFHATLPFATTGWYVSDWNRAEGLGAFTLWVHGFRMPLFLFVSGYFTQMMWRRKGLAPKRRLIWSRSSAIILRISGSAARSQDSVTELTVRSACASS